MNQLFRHHLKQLRNQPGITVPPDSVFQLPEKVLQFGTGAFLRGLADYYIDKANRQGIFNGRIVVVKSTTDGDPKAFERQDNLYTICTRGIVDGRVQEENIVSSAISRVLLAKTHWSLVLDLAKNPAVSIVISNTTETGIQLVQDDIYQWPPVSFPGKLLAFLYARYVAFGGNPDYGVVIIPTELIADNGRKLEAIVLELAHRNGLEGAFIDWLEDHNHFCNSLVDRIVPGKPDPALQQELEQTLGYRDELLITAEQHHLWVIEGDEKIRQKIPFYGVDEGLVIAEDIQLYRELKLRLLNGAHTLACGVAHLCGFETVFEAMENPTFAAYVSGLIESEIALAIPYPIETRTALNFGRQVMDRLRNPYIRHHWLHISQNYSAKIASRVAPVFLQYEKKYDELPEHMLFGFAAYICFMKTARKDGEQHVGFVNDAYYPIHDQKAAFFHQKWLHSSVSDVVKTILKDQSMWGRDLSKSEAIVKTVIAQVEAIRQHGALEALRRFVPRAEFA